MVHNSKIMGTIYLLTLNINSEYLYKNEQPIAVAHFLMPKNLEFSKIRYIFALLEYSKTLVIINQEVKDTTTTHI